MNIEKQVSYWLDSAQHDLDAAQALYDSGKYDWCLFLGHLVIEKTLKALFVKEAQQIPPKTHNLLIIASGSHLQLTQEQSVLLERINDFNMEARYPDEKLSFYSLCTKEFASDNFIKIKELYSWFLRMMK